jgi:hypothetical protein
VLSSLPFSIRATAPGVNGALRHSVPSKRRYFQVMSVCILLSGTVFMGLWLTACEMGTPEKGTEIESALELVAVLEEAGADVSEVGVYEVPAFDVPARMFQVDQSLIHVYEYPDLKSRLEVSQTISQDGMIIDWLPVTWPDRPNIWAMDRLIVVYPGTDGGLILLLCGLLGDPITRPISPADEPYPPAVSAAIQSLSESLNINPGRIEVLSYEPVDWPDSCLGLPELGEACAEVITPGWEITLMVGGQSYEVRADQYGDHLRHQ